MLGLKRGIVLLVEHDEAWEPAAKAAISRIKAVLGPIMLGAEHVGSTSIRGIKAKPIIDIAVGVGDFGPVYGMVGKMEEAGFIHNGENDRDWQVYFFCALPGSEIVTHHIHVVKFGGRDWDGYIRFRDRLNRDREAARKYEELKEGLMRKFPGDREGYTDGKAEFIVSVLMQEGM